MHNESPPDAAAPPAPVEGQSRDVLFRDAYREARPLARALVRRGLGARYSDATFEDLFHNAMILFWNALRAGTYRDEGHARAYIARIVYYLLLNLRGRAATEKAEPLSETIAAATDNPEALLAEAELIAGVHACMADLEARDRDALRLALEGVDGAVAASDMGLSYATYRKVLSRAREKLASRLEARGVSGKRGLHHDDQIDPID